MDSSTSHSHHSLIVRLQDNDGEAWEEFVDLFAPLIFHWCQRLNLGTSDSSDVMQEVFAAVSVSISNFRNRGNGTLRGWLWTITQNKVRDFYRRNRHRESALGGSAAQLKLAQMIQPIDEQSFEELTSVVQSKRLLHRALRLIENDFKESTWQAFWRATIEGQPTNSIAQDLGISPNSVRQSKSRVLRRLREQLGDF
jgi:RNA polymerase sigma-70 factor (ECF subfamily)